MSLEQARLDLIARQGKGARFDAPSAPADDLLTARRLTAALARLINDVPDSALSRTSTAARTVAGLSLSMRRMSEAFALIRTADQAGPIRISLDVPADEIALAATLPPRALRHLFDHTRVHLNVEWRDLPDSHWDRAAIVDHGAELPVRQLPALHAANLMAVIRVLET